MEARNPDIQSLLEELRAAVDGLLYPSESDEPFTVDAWPMPEHQDAAATVLAHAGEKTQLKTQPLAEFFVDLRAIDEDGRFAALQKLLLSRLKDIKVFRAAEREVDVYVVGAAGHHWIVLRTRSIET